jgi:hypothetical protein
VIFNPESISIRMNPAMPKAISRIFTEKFEKPLRDHENPKKKNIIVDRIK